MQIRRLLRAINWTFMCAEGLDDLVQKRQLQKQKLEEVEEKIKTFSTQGYDAYHEKYEKTKGIIKDKLAHLKDFTIGNLLTIQMNILMIQNILTN